MVAVITGDIVNSRDQPASQWLPRLKEVLEQYGKVPKEWEIFRGDSFQLLVLPKDALLTALHIKATIKQIKDLDVRIAIGIGNQDYEAAKISESNGEAFVRSGECFDHLRKKLLAIQTADSGLNSLLNLLFDLALLTFNSWSSTVASAVKTSLEHPDKSQVQVAQLLKRSQSSLSEALKRGGFEEMLRLNDFYKKEIKSL